MSDPLNCAQREAPLSLCSVDLTNERDTEAVFLPGAKMVKRGWAVVEYSVGEGADGVFGGGTEVA